MNRTLKQLLAALLAVGIAHSNQAVAATITKVEAGPAQPVLTGGKVTVKFTVTGSAEDSDKCGIWIDYGDGDSPDTRIMGKNDGGLFPRVFEHTFTKPGGFSVKVKGQRVKQTFGCSGEAGMFINVTAPAAAVTGPAMPTCPDGWQLAAKSYNKSTGAYACQARPPASKLECGKGLAYYEKDGMIGCAKGR